jgi:hypothetical protein
MKFPRSGFAALLAACFMSVAAFAADPAGNWKWSIEFNGQPFESTARFDVKDGKLTGVIRSGQMGELPISDGSFKDGLIAFNLVIDANGTNFVVKYQGKLEGDAINGSINAPGFEGGEPLKFDWKAQRLKDDQQPEAPAKAK